MKINQDSLLNQVNSLNRSKQGTNKLNNTLKSNEVDNRKPELGFNDIFQTGPQFNNFKVDLDTGAFYNNSRVQMDAEAVDRLMKESEDIRGSIKQMVRDMLEQQGITIDELKSGRVDKIEVDETTRQKAQELIGPGGELSPEKVSDRIVDFSIAAFGGDKNKIGIIRDSIDRGFAEAKRMLGGDLADVSKETYQLIQQKLDAWMNENEEGGGESQPN